MIIQPSLTEAFLRGSRLGKQDRSLDISNYEPLNSSWEGKTAYQIIDELLSGGEVEQFYHELCDTFCAGYFEGNRKPRVSL